MEILKDALPTAVRNSISIALNSVLQGILYPENPLDSTNDAPAPTAESNPPQNQDLPDGGEVPAPVEPGDTEDNEDLLSEPSESDEGSGSIRFACTELKSILKLFNPSPVQQVSTPLVFVIKSLEGMKDELGGDIDEVIMDLASVVSNLKGL